jgi:hypothetical protein
LRRADHSSKSYCLCEKDYETEGEARAQQLAVKPLMNERMKVTHRMLRIRPQGIVFGIHVTNYMENENNYITSL